MTIIITAIVLSIIFGIGYIVGAKQLINKIKKDGGYFDMEITGAVYPYVTEYPTSSVNEVPTEFLMGGNIDRTLHIAGIKKATPAKLAGWQDERRAKVETKTELSMDGLLSKLNPDDMKLKAGITPHDRNEGNIDFAKKMMSKVKVDDVDPIEIEKIKIRAAKKQHEMDRENQLKIDFEALNFSRISNEARQSIAEIVRKDIENKMKVIETNTPEIIPNEKPDAEFMHKWIKQKSGK